MRVVRRESDLFNLDVHAYDVDEEEGLVVYGGNKERERLQRDKEKALTQNPIRTRYRPREERQRYLAEEFTNPHSAFRPSVQFDNLNMGLRRTGQEIKALAGAAVTMVDALMKVSGSGADRAQFELIEMLNKTSKPDALKGANLVEQQKRTKAVKEVCGIEDVKKPDHDYSEKCRCLTGADLHRQMRKEERGHMTTEEYERETIRLVEEKFEKEARSSIRDQNVITGRRLSVEVPVLESMNRRSLLRPALEHEVLCDFDGYRLCLPRWLRGECAGQMLSIIATPNDVALLTHVPKRAALESVPTKIEQVFDLSSIDLQYPGTDGSGIASQPLQSHGHLHVARRPVLSKHQWAGRGGLASRVVLEDEKELAKADEHSSDGSDDFEGVAGGAAGAGEAGPSTGAGLQDKLRAQQRAVVAGFERRRRGGVGAAEVFAAATDADSVPWDARKPLHQEGFDEMANRTGFVLPEETTLDFKLPELQWSSYEVCLAQKAEKSNRFAVERFQAQTWTLQPVGSKFQIEFTIGGDTLPADENETSENNADEDDQFWRDFFTPMPVEPTPGFSLQGCFW